MIAEIHSKIQPQRKNIRTMANAVSMLDELQVGRLFDRFYTMESAQRSNGLGLSISKALSEQMGGEIHASLADGRLTIQLTFPA